MEDLSVEYVLVPYHPHHYNCWQFLRPTVEHKEEDDDGFVLVSLGEIEHASCWWKSLRNCAFLAAREGVKRSCLKKALPNLAGFQPRRFSINCSFDWVSETCVDGGRLILPGQLISLDKHFDLTQGVSSSSTIMVSAHELLAYQSCAHERDIPPSSFTTLRGPWETMMQLFKHRTRILANATRKSLSLSTSANSRQAGSLLLRWEHNTGLVANTAGWICQTLELCSPSVPSMGDEMSNLDCTSLCDGETIELPTFPYKF